MKNLQKLNLRESQLRMAGVPGWAIQEQPGFLANRSPGLQALGNDLWAEPSLEHLAMARAFFGAQPFYWLLEEGQDGGFLDAAGAGEPEPLPEMVFPLRAGPLRPTAPGCEIARADSRLAFQDWNAIVSRTFGLDPEVSLGYFGPLCRIAGSIPFLARVDGQPAATALLFPGTTGAGVFAVATLEPFRRRGLGAAMVGACLREALAGPCEWAVLCSTAAGRSLYERLGFRTVQVLREYRMPGSATGPGGTGAGSGSAAGRPFLHCAGFLGF